MEAKPFDWINELAADLVHALPEIQSQAGIEAQNEQSEEAGIDYATGTIAGIIEEHWERSIAGAVPFDEGGLMDQAQDEMRRLKESFASAWEELEATRADRDRLRAGLEMLAQIRNACGSAQAVFRSNLRIVDAVLAGANVEDLATIMAIADGTWKPTEAKRESR